MWQCTRESQNDGRVERRVPGRNGAAIPYREVLRLWQRDEGFRTFFIASLSDAPFAEYRWETPAITAATADRPFEFILMDAPRLARQPDAEAFGEQFRLGSASVLTFANLGKDAVLVVPRPAGPAEAYVHLASFVRQAPESQVHELWRSVGAAMESGLGPRPIWLSTAGMGVAWLHVRLDSRPKYYGFEPYRALP